MKKYLLIVVFSSIAGIWAAEETQKKPPKPQDLIFEFDERTLKVPAIRGVFEDYYGNPVPRTGLAVAGAVQEVGDTPPGPTDVEFVVVLPQISATDVTSRVLTVINNTIPTILRPAISDQESESLFGEFSATLHVELVDVDDAGNRSEPSILDTQLPDPPDTEPPPKPGPLSIRIIE